MQTYQQRSHKFFNRARQKAEDVKNDEENKIEMQKKKEDILRTKRNIKRNN